MTGGMTTEDTTDDGKGQQSDRRHDNGGGRHDDGDGRHDDGRHDDGKGQQATGGTTRRRRFDNDNDGTMMGNRKLASTAPPIRGNYQLMLIVGGEETREGEDCGG